jgi:hypothetical protein
MEFGARVTLTQKYTRVKRGHDKTWEVESCNYTGCIFLGNRVLANGSVYCDYDEGCSFTPHAYIKAVLVCPSKNLSPVYAPLDAVIEEG